MGEFKTGDNALVVKATCKENIGKVVRLIESTDAEEIAYGNNMVTLNPRRLLVWHVEGDLVTVDLFDTKYQVTSGVVPEKWLMPLDGHVPDAEDQFVLSDIGRGLLKPVIEVY